MGCFGGVLLRPVSGQLLTRGACLARQALGQSPPVQQPSVIVPLGFQITKKHPAKSVGARVNGHRGPHMLAVAAVEWAAVDFNNAMP